MNLKKPLSAASFFAQVDRDWRSYKLKDFIQKISGDSAKPYV